MTASTGSVTRLIEARAEVGKNTSDATAQHHMRKLTKPGSLASGMKKAGIALIATPDPITGIIGVPLLASSYVMKKREPTTLGNLAEETRRVLREMQSLRL